MFCRRDQWKAPNFPRQVFHDSNSKAGRVLMHSKVRMHISLNISDDPTLPCGVAMAGLDDNSHHPTIQRELER